MQKCLVSVKHMGIKKLLLPALNKIPNIHFDVLLNDLNGLTDKDDIHNLNLHVKRGMASYTYPQDCSLKDSLAKLGINLHSYNAVLMAGLCSTGHLFKEYTGNLYIYTVAPFYRAQLPEDVFANNHSHRNNKNTLIIHSTPYHFKEYKKRYENKWISNTTLLAHGLNPDAWGQWNGKNNKILTIWGGFKDRIKGKKAVLNGKWISGMPMVNEIVCSYPYQYERDKQDGYMTEEYMRESLRNFRCHFLFMKDQLTIGLVESLRVGIPIAIVKGTIIDPVDFLKPSNLISDYVNILKPLISEYMDNYEFAKKISKAEQETCDEVFSWNRYVKNWEILLTSKINNTCIELPQQYIGAIK